ncbi:hypothetical protein CGRA01v4_10551 [Colletotrichum graminicola]|uniref:NADAR domain-containing protein n=1 Tax=Colletotrichum graminicola (strain M1.001 / M2 / FGSC 10212) TaxID=645133 RepID=E3QK71_COLGM|nr:uncharacterized protein GLRG_06403 [Colletotrichum graminicola M1.001]EFQ31259.1 hypothetical protein GLRG_06403 [Colletotrichum graminicola M1.001]WDK19264.1 hypothetical protein CGRA01v4_10551 [Colletotrichum graminicola]
MDTSPIYFWGQAGEEGYLSQWWARDPFTSSSPPVTFKTAEHYMMHGKALLFGDADAARAVLRADNPRKAKALGRRVRGFDEALWTSHRERVVREGNLLKFRCAPELREKLLATGERELVEASPLDRVWGIGFGPEEAPSTDRHLWGLNLLGKVLMEVRKALREEHEMQRERKEEKSRARAKRQRAQVQDVAGQGEESRRMAEGG